MPCVDIAAPFFLWFFCAPFLLKSNTCNSLKASQAKKNALSPCQNVKKKENILLNTTAAAVERGKAGGFNLNLIFGNIKNKDEMKKKFLMLFMGTIVKWSQKNNNTRRRWNSEQKNLFIIPKHVMGARLALSSSIFFIQNLHSAKINARSQHRKFFLINLICKKCSRVRELDTTQQEAMNELIYSEFFPSLLLIGENFMIELIN